MASVHLTEIDYLQVTVLVDNEVDPMSPTPNPAVETPRPMRGIPLVPLDPGDKRGEARVELRMDSICGAAHGLSLMITAVKGEKKHTLLFDAGPEEEVWERNARRLRLDLGAIEHIHLSHFHRDHSGGLLRAVRLINDGKEVAQPRVVVDVHPDRPDFRGMKPEGMNPVSLEADPSFEQIVQAGATLEKTNSIHTVLDDMFLISGEIPRQTAYEEGLRGGVRFFEASGIWEPDELIRDERFVLCNLKGKGLVLFTGCSHAGVVNASRHALDVGGGTPLYAIVGGFHLADSPPEKLQSTFEDLQALGPKVLIPGHCTGWRFKYKIEAELAGILVPCFSGQSYTLRSEPHFL